MWRLPRSLLYAASLAGAAIAAGYGFDFGQRIGGLWLGILLAINAGVFVALLVAMALDGLSRPR